MTLKRLLAALLSAVLLLGVLLSLVACNPNETAVKVNTERYNAKPISEMTTPYYEAQYSFYDTDYEYFFFYLGCVEHVPLQNNVAIYEYNGNPTTHKFTSTKTTATTLTEMISILGSLSVSVSLEGSYNASSTKGTKTKLMSEIGFKGTISTEVTVSRTDSFSKTVAYSEEHSETTEFSFDDSMPTGFYRYILLGDIDVFGVLVRDRQSGEYHTDTYEVIASQYFTLDYSSSSRFERNNTKKLTLEMTAEEVAALAEPSTCIQTFYDSGYQEKKIDASYEYDYDRFNISVLSPFMNENYNFHFAIEVYMKEEDEGYQEVYLVNSNGSVLAGTGANSFAHGGGGVDGWGWETFNFTVNAENCTSEMILRYGASGKNSDDWYRGHAKVTVTVQMQ